RHRRPAGHGHDLVAGPVEPLDDTAAVDPGGPGDEHSHASLHPLMPVMSRSRPASKSCSGSRVARSPARSMTWPNWSGRSAPMPGSAAPAEARMPISRWADPKVNDVRVL